MVKVLNLWGKLLYCFTAFFPLYVYWAYYFSTKIYPFKIENLINFDQLLFFILLLFSIFSLTIFYHYLIKREKYEKEIFIKSSEKDSKYMQYFVGALSPFILFLIEFIRDTQIYNDGIIVGTIVFILLGFIFVCKDEYGILYNIFLIRYKILRVKTKDEKDFIIITKKDNLSGYTKVTRLSINSIKVGSVHLSIGDKNAQKTQLLEGLSRFQKI